MPGQEASLEKETSGEYPNLFVALGKVGEASRRWDRATYNEDGTIRVDDKSKKESDRLSEEFSEAIKAAEVSGATSFDIDFAHLAGVHPDRRQQTFEGICDSTPNSFAELQVLQDRFELARPVR